MPLCWSEVQSSLTITDYTIKTVPNIIAKRKDNFKGVLGNPIDMAKAIECLNNL
jgi:bifunctional non-homologous end joining protein LigD